MNVEDTAYMEPIVQDLPKFERSVLWKIYPKIEAESYTQKPCASFENYRCKMDPAVHMA